MSSDKLPPVGGGEAPAQPDFEGSDERTQPLRRIDPHARQVSGPLAGLPQGRQAARESQASPEEASSVDPYREAADMYHDRFTAQLQKQRLHEAKHGREPAPATPRQLADAYFMMRQGHSLEEAARAFGIESPADIEDLREFAEKNLPRA
jgi:hypothetical protein